MTGPLDDAIEAHLASWDDPAVERLIFATATVGVIAGELRRFCRVHLGAAIDGCTFVTTSVGFTVGLRVAERDVVVKAYQPRWPESFLGAVVRAQAIVSGAGFPCARPLAGPLPFGAGLATVESMWPEPCTPPGPAGAPERAASASSLAWMVDLLRPHAGDPGLRALADHPLREQTDRLWGAPHSPLFDFGPSTGTAEASMIDDLAARGQAQRDLDLGVPAVVIHTDWSLRNIRLAPPRAGTTDHRLVGAYDWDSLALIAETTGVGQAAQTWNATGEPGSPARPDAGAIAAYVRDYERARGAPFTTAERQAIGGAALYNLGYIARCELALEHRYPTVVHDRTARDRLATDDDALLRLDELM